MLHQVKCAVISCQWSLGMHGRDSPLVFRTIVRRTRTHDHQICRMLAAIHKHDPLVIPVSSFLCIFVSCSLWCARPSVYVWGTAAKGPPHRCFPQLCSSSHCLAREFHATLHEPNDVPNSAVAPLSPDISVAFQRLRWEEKFSDQLSGNLFQRLAAHASTNRHQPRLNVGLRVVSLRS